jgi:Ferritin-like domain
VTTMDFRLVDVDTDGALRDASERVGISRAQLLGGTFAGLAAAFAAPPPAGAAVNGNDAAVLNFALVLEYLQSSFYTEAERSKGLHGKAADAARRVGAVERAHVVAFKKLLGSAAGKRPSFDFRGVTERQQPFLKTAVAFEDLAVAAYKGQAPRLRSRQVLASAIAIHSVEARHAAWMRYLFGVQPAVHTFDDPVAKPGIERVVGATGFIVSKPKMEAHHSPKFTG